jgi:glutathione S-transferase
VIAEAVPVVTENAAILPYIAQRFPKAALWPSGPREAGRAAEWIGWIASTVHIAYAHVRRPERYASDPKAIEDVVAKGKESCRDIWGQVDRKLGAGPWSIGERFSIADPYLLVFWTWGRGPTLGFDMAKDFPSWTAHARRMGERPAVKRAFEREGLELPT